MFENVPSWANNYIGIDYSPMGRLPESGLDCYGLVYHIYRCEFDIMLPAYVGSYASPEEHEEIGRLIRAETSSDWISVQVPGLGDVALFDVHGEPAHTAVVVWPGIMLHIRRGAGSCLERYDTPTWKPRLVGFYRHPRRT